MIDKTYIFIYCLDLFFKLRQIYTARLEKTENWKKKLPSSFLFAYYIHLHIDQLFKVSN